MHERATPRDPSQPPPVNDWHQRRHQRHRPGAVALHRVDSELSAAAAAQHRSLDSQSRTGTETRSRLKAGEKHSTWSRRRSAHTQPQDSCR